MENMNFSMIEMGRVDTPVSVEGTKARTDYVPYGILSTDDFYQVITEAYDNSTTTNACIEGISDLIFGKGLYSNNLAFNDTLQRIVNQEDIKRIAFDVKLFGSFAMQVYWNDEHTKIIKMYHTPVQNWRAEKITDEPMVKNYFYCVDWNDYKSVKNRKIYPSYGTSKEKMEVLFVKTYAPGKYYYGTPDWFASLQYSFIESEISNYHFNAINSGFFPSTSIQFFKGVPPQEERQRIENQLNNKFGGVKNANRLMVIWNENMETAAKIEPITIENAHERISGLSEHAQDKILVSHRVTSPLLFGIRTANNGFSSQSEEMTTAYSIMSTMTINPFQNIIINSLTDVLQSSGYQNVDLYFEQLTPLVILSETADETGQTIDQVQDDVNDVNETPENN